MPEAVGAAAMVTHPDVVAAVGQQEGQRSVRWTDQPLGARLEDAVLEQHRPPARVRDAMQFQDVAVVRRDQVPLGWVAAVLDQFDLQKQFRQVFIVAIFF